MTDKVNKMKPLEQKIIDKTSKNEYAKKVVGLRKLPKNTIIFDQPCELDYHCPVCKYDNIVNGNYDERLEWSEYNEFIWCSVCNKDYPSCFCIPDMDKAIDIFLTSLQQVREETIKETNEQICNASMMVETALGYLEMENAKQALKHLEVAQSILCPELQSLTNKEVNNLKRNK